MKMFASRSTTAPTSAKSGFSGVLAVGQHFLTFLGESARRADEQRRFAALPRRYLDDADLTPSDFPVSWRGLDAIAPRHAAMALIHSV
jgi:hypothetical protein